jgi:DNA-binding MarR family transcriptional regulator
VLCWLQQNIGFNNRIEFFRQQDIADALKTNQAHISRALNRLLKDEIIQKDGHHYVFAPKYVRYAFDSKIERDE